MRGVSRLFACAALMAAVIPFGPGADARHSSSGILNCPIDADCTGSSRAEIITVNIDSGGDNIIDGRGGRDVITGVGAGDLLIGGRGTDIINGGGGDFIDSNDRRLDLVNCLDGDVLVDFDNRDLISGPCEFDPGAF